MDPSERLRLHEALEAAGGNRGLAAVALALTPEDLRRQINGDAELKLAWGASVPALAEAPLEINEGNSDQAMAAAFLKDDAALADGLEELGLSVKEQKLARALRKFHSKHFFASMDMIGAGVTRTALKLQTEMERLEGRLVDVRELIGEWTGGGGQGSGDSLTPDFLPSQALMDRASLVAEERSLLASYIAMSDQLRKIFEISNRSTLLLAGIRLKLLGKKDGPMKSGKPGFSNSNEY